MPACTTMVRWNGQYASCRGTGEGTYANDALGADELDQLVLNAALGVTLGVGLEVTKVTDMALLVTGGTVCLVLGVDYY